MITNECNIIRDILPLYAENMVSADTAAFVRQHLNTCPSCQNELAGTTTSEHDDYSAADAAPLKRIRAKLIKRVAALIVIAAVIAAAIGYACSYYTPPTINYGTSEKYTQDNIASAAKAVKLEFHSWGVGKLYSIDYTDDETCTSSLGYCNSLTAGDKTFTESIVLTTYFKTSSVSGSELQPDQFYRYTWYLARTEGGIWEVLTCGQT